MTPRQIALARHALGLSREQKTSYRNHFSCGEGHPDYEDWRDMVASGNAVRWPAEELSFGGDDLFKLTATGAAFALLPDESLDPRDFLPRRT